MKRVLILGITGSIGKQALELENQYDLVGFSYFQNVQLAEEILKKHSNKNLLVYSPKELKLNNVQNFEELIIQSKPDLVLNAVVGFDGIFLTKFCLENGIDVALANKESLVIGGSFITDILKKNPDVHLYPVDSEHSSLYQLYQCDPKKIKKIYITASGGPFYHLNNDEMFNKTFEQAIKHPKWNMGYKISIDSATLINKCFELIEAFYLFENVEIQPLYHPQSIVHSMVEYIDNSVFANLSKPDMKIAISLALNEFDKLSNVIEPLSFKQLSLTFDEIDSNKWKPIKWAYELFETKNKAMGVIINTVNDYLIELFKNQQIVFGQIVEIIEHYLNKFKNYPINSWDDLFNLHKLIQEDLLSNYKGNNYGKIG